LPGHMEPASVGEAVLSEKVGERETSTLPATIQELLTI